MVPSNSKYVAVTEEVSDTKNVAKFSVYLKTAFLKESQDSNEMFISVVSELTEQNITVSLFKRDEKVQICGWKLLQGWKGIMLGMVSEHGDSRESARRQKPVPLRMLRLCVRMEARGHCYYFKAGSAHTSIFGE